MTVRLARTPAEDDDGITIAAAARIVGCDPSTIRELVRIGELEGWKVGKTRNPTGVRVSRGSCFEYRQKNSTVEACARDSGNKTRPRRARSHRPSAAHLEALAELRARGVRV